MDLYFSETKREGRQFVGWTNEEVIGVLWTVSLARISLDFLQHFYEVLKKLFSFLFAKKFLLFEKKEKRRKDEKRFFFFTSWQLAWQKF